MIEIATVCSGIGSPEVAIEELAVEHVIKFACDIDKYARASYLANFTPKAMYTDMTAESWIGEQYHSDLFIGGIPCQAFSLAGKRLGELDKRGLLFYDFYRYVDNQRPKAFIIENVKGLLSNNGGKTFQNWLLLLGDSVNGHHQMFNHPESLGYNLHHTVLNAKDFGLPQNRERVFIIGIRPDMPNSFRFPSGFKLTTRLKDILEPIVDEKYYLSDKMVHYLNNRKDNFNSGKINYKTQDDVASCISASSRSLDISDNIIIEQRVAGYRENENTISGYRGDAKRSGMQEEVYHKPDGIANTLACAHVPKIIEPQILQRARRKNNGGLHDISPTITSNSFQENNHLVTKQRIRKLTPLECWRLQGFPDENFYNAKAVPTSDSQLYKQAGNSMASKVMKAIIKNLLPILLKN